MNLAHSSELAAEVAPAFESVQRREWENEAIETPSTEKKANHPLDTGKAAQVDSSVQY